jgi:hypothetical protein
MNFAQKKHLKTNKIMENKIPQIGTKEFNDLASACFGGKPKQETLEEAAKKYANKNGDIPTTELEDAIFKQGFIDGAKWQQEKSYSEEDMTEAFRVGFNLGCNAVESLTNEIAEEWFKNGLKKFKNK